MFALSPTQNLHKHVTSIMHAVQIFLQSRAHRIGFRELRKHFIKLPTSLVEELPPRPPSCLRRPWKRDNVT